MNLKIDMYIRVPRWDNDLVNQKEEQNEAVKITKQDQFGYERTFIIRRDEIDPDFGFVVFEVTVAYLLTQSII